MYRVNIYSKYRSKGGREKQSRNTERASYNYDGDGDGDGDDDLLCVITTQPIQSGRHVPEGS